MDDFGLEYVKVPISVLIFSESYFQKSNAYKLTHHE